MCLYSRIVKNKRYTENSKNGGVIPPLTDERTLYVPLKCGNCKECRKAYAREWQVRLMEDIKKHKNGKFITLTFSNESIKELNELTITVKNPRTKLKETINIRDLQGYDKDNAIAKKGVRLFLERWRKKYGKSLRHWLVTELGGKGTENVHLHGIIWTDEKMEEVEKAWKYGYIWKGKRGKNGTLVNYVNEATVNYITKYISKVDLLHKTYKGKVLTTAGIGSNYIERPEARSNTYKEGETKETYRTRTGHKIGLPIYWRNKIYSEEEREKLWIEKLDKQIRWVDGQKIDISKGEEEYFKALKVAQEKSKKLGYGTSQKNWERAKYELERRKLILKHRIDNTFAAVNNK